MTAITPKRLHDVYDGLEIVDEEIQTLLPVYQRALEEQSIPIGLRFEVKHVLGDLRTILDYIACDIYDKYCAKFPPANPKARVYFPFGKSSPQEFTKWCKASGMQNLRVLQSIFDYLELLQPFRSGPNWLPDLCSVVNHDKHDSLTPQTKLEHPVTVIEPENASPTHQIFARNVVLPPGSKLEVDNLRVVAENASIAPESVVKDGKPLQQNASGQIVNGQGVRHENQIWVTFVLEVHGKEIDALDLIHTAQRQVRRIADDLYKFL